MATMDLNQEWGDICREFVLATGYPIDHSDCDAQSIIDKLADAKAKDEEAKAHLAQAQKYLGNTIKVIQRVGGIAATGASMVFGSPASITMNCINFLIDAGVEYKNITANIETIFGQIASVMQRLQLCIENQAILNPAMTRTTHDMLIAIVRVCKLCGVKLKEHRKAWGKVAQFTKLALWSSDGGIKAQLGVLATLEARELQMKSSVTMIATEVTKRNVEDIKVTVEVTKRNVEDIKVTSNQLVTAVADFHKSSTEEKELKVIREKLGVDDASSSQEYKTYRDKLPAEACAWLKEDADYQDWLGSGEDHSPILVLRGDQGYGKSFTLTSIVRDLREKYPQNRQDANRTSVAHCYVTKTGSKGSKDKVTQTALSIRDVLRIWAWQIINNDLVYSKDVQSLLKNNAEFEDLSDMWSKLFADHLSKGAAFYLLLDGLQELEDNDLEELAALSKMFASASGRLKLVLACRPQTLEKLQVSDVPMTFMELHEKNQPDLERHINNKVDGLAIFQKTTGEISELRAYVCNGLLEAVDGNFLLADTKLAEIGTKYDPGEIRKLIDELKESGANVSDSIDDAIRACNSTLTIGEVEDLNCILRWTIYGKWYLQVFELQAIIYVENGRSSPMLAKMIKDKFSSLLTLSDTDNTEDPVNADVYLKYDSSAEYFTDLANQQSSQTSASHALSPGEIGLVQHFIEKLCSRSIYDRLGLANFFDQKLAQLGASVAVDCENAPAMLTFACLRVLVEGPTEDSRGLLNYASVNLADHLQEIDTDTVDPAIKSKLGALLVDLFRSAAAIQRYTENIWEPISYNDDALVAVVRLLRSSAVIKGVASSDPEARKWVEEIRNQEHAELALLGDAAKVEANLWLTSQDSELTMRHFHWLNGYRNKMESLVNADTRMTEKPEDAQLSVDGIESTVALAQKLLEMDKLGARELRGLALVYRESGNLTKAIEALKSALEIEPSYLLAHLAISIAYAREVEDGPRPDYEAALHHVDIVIDEVRNGVQLFEDEDTKVTLKADSGLLPKKSNYLRKLARYREAQRIYEDVLSEDPENNFFRRQLVDTLCEAEYFPEVVTFLQTLYEKEDGNTTKGSYLSSFFMDNAYDSDYHSSVVRAFKQAGQLPDIQGHYRWVIESTNKSRKAAGGKAGEIMYAYFSLNYYFGLMLRRYGGLEEKQEAVRLWEAVIDKARKDNNLTYACVLAARSLSKAYVATAMEHGHGSETATLMLARLNDYLLVKSGDDDDDWQMGLSPAQLRTLLGRYYRKVGQVKEARDHIRPAVELGLQLLTDDTTENDYQGYRRLGDAFMDFGDDDNARAAWSLIQPNPETQPSASPLTNGHRSESPDNDNDKQDVNATADTNGVGDNKQGDEDELFRRPSRSLTMRVEKRTGPLGYSCDGRCGTSSTYTDGFYICRECVDVQFDEPCYNKLRKGELARDICDPTHEFLRVDSWSPESEDRFKSGKVLVGERMLGLEEWLQAIRRDWNLPGEAKDATTETVVNVEVVAKASTLS